MRSAQLRPSSLARLRRLVLAVVSTAFVAVGLAAPSPAAAYAVPGPEFVGLNTQGLVKDTTIDPSLWGIYWDQMQAGQMGIARLQISWQTAEPTAPVNGVHTYNWNAGGAGRDSIDYAMATLAQRGIRAAPLFATVPPWINAGNAYRMTSAAYGNFAAFVAAFAARYGPGGAFWAEHQNLTPLPTLEYEIWTEANSTNFWTGNVNAGEYALAMKTIAPQLHAAQPGATLLASIGWQNYQQYMNDFFAAGGGGAIDGVGFHPYAPTTSAIMGLTTGLRAKLTALGRGDIPIYITESGQPVTYSGGGAASAGSGSVTDAARAATQTFAVDALARSNCGVQQFLVYGITGTETNKEAIGEGYMGVLHHSNGSPNVTGAALQRASKRWVAQYGAGNGAANSLSLCGGSATPDASMVAMGLSLKRVNDTCALGTAGYDGNPIEGATLQVSAPGRGSYGQPTNAYGQNTVCLINGSGAATYFDVYSSIPNAGKSAVYRCKIPVSNTSCSPIVAAPNPVGSPQPLDATGSLPADNTAFTPPGTVTLNSACDCSSSSPSPKGGSSSTPSAAAIASACPGTAWKIALSASHPTRDKAGTRSTVKVTAKLSCPKVAAGTRVRFVVQLLKKGAKHPTKLTTVKLNNLHKVHFAIHTKVAKGDQIVLLHAVTALTQDGVPRLRKTISLTTPK